MQLPWYYLWGTDRSSGDAGVPHDKKFLTSPPRGSCVQWWWKMAARWVFTLLKRKAKVCGKTLDIFLEYRQQQSRASHNTFISEDVVLGAHEEGEVWSRWVEKDQTSSCPIRKVLGETVIRVSLCSRVVWIIEGGLCWSVFLIVCQWNQCAVVYLEMCVCLYMWVFFGGDWHRRA